MKRHFGGVVVAALVLVLASGCSAAAGLPDSGPLAMYPRPDAGMDALLEGTLRVVDGCVTVESADAASVVPVFPVGDATWSDDTLTRRGETYRSGDAIALGGGFSAGTTMEGAYIPEGCASLELFTVSPF